MSPWCCIVSARVGPPRRRIGARSPPSLQAYGAAPQMTSVSGLSSGGFMAVQLQVAYSKSIIGAGIVAGGPYYCAANSKLAYVSICMGQVPFFPPNPYVMAAAAKQSANAHKIDPLSNLTERHIYVFSGTDDHVVKQPAVNATTSFFRLVGVREDNVTYVNDVPAGHAVIALGYGNECSTNSPPYISHCTSTASATTRPKRCSRTSMATSSHVWTSSGDSQASTSAPMPLLPPVWQASVTYTYHSLRTRGAVQGARGDPRMPAGRRVGRWQVRRPVLHEDGL